MTSNTPPLASTGGFKNRESPLLDILRALSSGEADWPTTKAALLDFDFVAPKPRPQRPADSNSPEYAEWYLDRDGDLSDPEPGTYEELDQAATIGMIGWDLYEEFNDAVEERSDAFNT